MADLNARCVAADVDLLDISSSPFGICGNCGEDVLEPQEVDNAPAR